MPPLVLLLISFAVILAGALLFTNAVEWMGHRLNMGTGAVGSLLAAVGTAMPETLIPIVAIIGGAEGAEDVAVGAIIGAPFLLATIAMGLVGVSAFIYKNRRDQGTELRAHGPTLRRDLRFFLIFFALGILVGAAPTPSWAQIPLVILFVVAYGTYVRRTLREGGDVQEVEDIGPLILDRTPHSVRAAIDSPMHSNLHDAVIPGFAVKWDLADLRELIRSRTLVWKDPTDWMGNVVALEGPYTYTPSDPNVTR